MKKKILACLLAVISMMTLVFVSACDEDGSLNIGDIVTIIKDEKAWDEAFNDLTYANLSGVVKYSDKYSSQENSVKITKDAVYYNIENQTEFYSKKENDGTYSTYLRGTDVYTDKTYPYDYFTLLNDKSDKYVSGAKKECILKVSFANYYELFKYNEAIASYTYDGEIETTAYLGGEITEKVICTNNIIKVENGKIVYIKCNYTYDEAPEGWLATLEYYDIGKTVVDLPQNVVDAGKDETNATTSSSYLVQQGTSSKPQ